MRQQMVKTIENLLTQDERLVLLLADVSRSLFENAFRDYPQRTLNLGILEQTMTSVAAGLALEGFIPVLHTIAPFLIERPFEQIKDDFCYQRLGGNFVSIGASYDYSGEGMTHQGSGDVQILKSLPGMQIVVPGTPKEFDSLFREAYANGSPTYYRLSTKTNTVDSSVEFGKLSVLKQGHSATIVAVGPMLTPVLSAVEDMDVTVLYCTTVAPFDSETLRHASQSSDIVVGEPYYTGVLVPDISVAMQHMPTRIEAIGVPHELLTHYGTPEQHDEALGLTPHHIRARIQRFLGEPSDTSIVGV